VVHPQVAIINLQPNSPHLLPKDPPTVAAPMQIEITPKWEAAREEAMAIMEIPQ